MHKTLSIRLIVTLLPMITVILGGSAQNSMKQLMTLPEQRVDSIFLGQPLNTRLDLIDYFEAGSKAFTRDSYFGANISLTKLDDRHATFSTDANLSINAYMLTPGTDSVMVFVIDTPLPDKDVFVKVDDIKTGKTIDSVRPVYSDWLNPATLAQYSEAWLLSQIPFVTYKADVDTSANTITLINTSITTPGLEQKITEVFKPSLKYIWNGKNFVLSTK